MGVGWVRTCTRFSVVPSGHGKQRLADRGDFVGCTRAETWRLEPPPPAARRTSIPCDRHAANGQISAATGELKAMKRGS